MKIFVDLKITLQIRQQTHLSRCYISPQIYADQDNNIRNKRYTINNYCEMYNSIEDLLTSADDLTMDENRQKPQHQQTIKEGDHNRHNGKNKSNTNTKIIKPQTKHRHDNQAFKSAYISVEKYDEMLISQNFENMQKQLLSAINSDSIEQQCKATDKLNQVLNQYFYDKRDIDRQIQRQEGDGKVYPADYTPSIVQKCHNLFNQKLITRIFELIHQNKCPKLIQNLSFVLGIMTQQSYFMELFMSQNIMPYIVKLFNSQHRLNSKLEQSITNIIYAILQDSYTVFISKLLLTGILQSMLLYAHRYSIKPIIKNLSMTAAKYSQMYMLPQGKQRQLLCTIICEYLKCYWNYDNQDDDIQNYTWGLIRLTSEYNQNVVAVLEKYNLWGWTIRQFIDSYGDNRDMLNIIRNFINYQACLSDSRISDFLSIVPYLINNNSTIRQNTLMILSDFVSQQIKHKQALLQNPHIISSLISIIRNDQHSIAALAIQIIGRLCKLEDYSSKTASKVYDIILQFNIPAVLANQITAAKGMQHAQWVIVVIQAVDSLLNFGNKFQSRNDNKITIHFKNAQGQKALLQWTGHQMGQIDAKVVTLMAKYFHNNTA